MAIFHMHIQIITRGAGKSAVAAAAYRSGETLTNERDGVTHDYTRKSGIFHSEILLPKNAPAEYAERSILWNSVKKAERYKTAQLAREIEIALPRELSHEESISLARRFVKETFVDSGMCADLSFHDKDNGNNPHVHAMLTMRPLNVDGSWGAKSRTVNGKKVPTVDWSERYKAEDWRKAWAAYCNAALTIKGAADRIDHRSYERQGLELIPTVHLGVAVMQMERRGIQTELGNRNCKIAERNKQLKQMKARIRKLEDWAKAEREKPPTLWEVFSNISKKEDFETLTNNQHIANVKLMADTLNFIKKYDIETLDNMTVAVKNLRDKHDEIKLQNSKDARRWGVLEEHIKHGENYGKHCTVYDKWRKMKEGSPQSDKYYDKHRDEITAFAAAHNYLTRVLNGNKKIPLENWKREFADLKNRYSLAKTELDSLAKEIKSAETIKRNAEVVMGVGRRRRDVEMDR
jgi:hypothetical protein